MLGGVVNISADRADVLSACFFGGKVDFGKNRRHGVIEIDHALRFEVFTSLRRVRPAIYRRIIADELAHPVERLAGGGGIFKYYRELVFIQIFVNLGDVAVKHIEQSVAFNDHDAVAVGVSLCLDVVNSV